MIFLKIKLWLYREEKQVRKFFYWHDRFKQVDREISWAYSLKNPYTISRKYLQEQGAADIHAYGETPLTTMRRIAHECAISSEDLVIEMGAGRGRSSFFLSEYIGCQVRAIEQIPEFVERAQEIAKKWNCTQVEFFCQDMFQTDFEKASVIYLYGTCLDEAAIKILIEKWTLLPSKINIITVSYPLSDYSKEFETLKRFSVPFPWGTGEVYLNQKIDR